MKLLFSFLVLALSFSSAAFAGNDADPTIIECDSSVAIAWGAGISAEGNEEKTLDWAKDSCSRLADESLWSQLFNYFLENYECGTCEDGTQCSRFHTILREPEITYACGLNADTGLWQCSCSVEDNLHAAATCNPCKDSDGDGKCDDVKLSSKR